jgi:hypothetical protein
MGTWVATINNPTARAGQLAPNYLYGVSFGFAGSPVRGTLGLTTGPAGKTAVLSVSGPLVATQNVTVPFPWTASGFYFLYMQQFGPGVWGALVYDLNANTWTPIGSIVVPEGWGKLSPTAVTTTAWLGSPAVACSAYPAADVVVHAPTGFRAGGATDAAYIGGGTIDGTCRSDQLQASPGWYLYRTGTP